MIFRDKGAENPGNKIFFEKIQKKLFSENLKIIFDTKAIFL